VRASGSTNDDTQRAGTASEIRPQRSRLERVRYSTGKPFCALNRAFTHEDWQPTTVETGAALVSTKSFGAVEIRLAATPSPAVLAALTSWLPGGETTSVAELQAMVREFGGQRGALIAQAFTLITAAHPYEELRFEDLRTQLLGQKRPPGRADPAEWRRHVDRRLFGSIVLGHLATAVGPVFSHGGEPGATEAWALYGIDHVRFDSSGTPVTITPGPLGLSRLLQDRPDAFEFLGYVRDLLALPDTTPGNWARAILCSLRQHWRLKVNTASCRKKDLVLMFKPIPRALLFGVQPDQPTPEQVLASNNPARAVEYCDAALDLLMGTGNGPGGLARHVSYWHSEPTRYCDREGNEPWACCNSDGTRRRARRGVAWR